MSGSFMVLTAVMLILCVALVAVVLMQSKNASGFSSAIGGMGESKSYWDKNKGRSIEGKLALYTRVLAVLYFIVAFVLCIIE
ncbi:MAG: preprotein translocase subunit SecG [Firmicutes bacterium]|nr:preprotein translocase subunit SecG [Bacillota bacterium]